MYCIHDGLLGRSYAIASEIRISNGLSIAHGALLGFLKNYAYPVCKIKDDPLSFFILYGFVWALWPWAMEVNPLAFHQWTLEVFLGLCILSFLTHVYLKRNNYL